MRGIRFFAAIALCAMPLSACADTLAAVGGLPSSPSAVCDKTTLDEQSGTGVELGYKAFRVAMELAVDSGKLHGAAATRVAKLDNQLFSATQAVESAYATCNAASYKAAIDQAHAALGAATAALKGN